MVSNPKLTIGIITYLLCGGTIFTCMVVNMVLSSQLINVGMRVANLEKQQQALLLDKQLLEKTQTGSTSILHVTQLSEQQRFVRVEKPIVIQPISRDQVAQR